MNKQDFKDSQVAIVGICVLLGLVLSTQMITSTFVSIKKDQTMRVTGAATKTIESDYAEWDGEFSCHADVLQAAYRCVQNDKKIVTDFLSKMGVPAESVKFDPPRTVTLKARDSRGYLTDQITGYDVYQTVRFGTNKMDIAEKAANDTSDLIAQGLHFVSHTPLFYYTKLDDLKVEMLGAATQNAHERASSMAESTGRHVGRLENANMGVFQITAENSTEVSDYGINDTSSRMKKITAVVNATFEIKN